MTMKSFKVPFSACMLTAMCLLLFGVCHLAADQNLDSTISAAKRGDPVALETIKKEFIHEVDTRNKQLLASIIIKSGDKSDVYWNFLFKIAEEGVQRDPPFPVALDDRGKPIAGGYTLEFRTWTQKYGLDVDEASQLAVYGYPIDIKYLGMSADPRGYDLFVRGLACSNYLIVASSAEGLARLQASPEVGKIIGACKRLAPAQAAVVARYLVYFNDPEAQAAADKFVSPAILQYLRSHFKDEGLKAIYGF